MQSERHLAVPEGVAAEESAAELLRVWMAESGVTVALRVDGLPAEAWGLILADIARHAAAAHARQGDGATEDMYRKIITVLMAEIQQPTDTIQSHP